jgi:hypothetical protein
MDEASMKIFKEKKRALSEGDDAVLHRVGEGKDIMSILRAFMNVSFVVIASLTTESSIAIVRANMDASAEDRLPDSELVAQMRWEWLHPPYLSNITSVRLFLPQRKRLPVPCAAPF